MSAKTSKYDRQRAALLSKGLSISRWALLRGYTASTVYDAIRGRRNGPLSLRIRKEFLSTIRS